MVFLKHNLLIKVVIAFVIFYWNVNGDCMESLKTDGLDKRTGFQNLASKVGCFEVKDEDTDFNVPNEYKLRVEKQIESFQKIDHELTIYGLSYVYHLIDLVKRPEQMLPPETWCKILECADSSMNLKPDTPFDEYINYASIKINTNSPAIRFCFIKTCHDTLVKPRDIISNTGFYGQFFTTYGTYKMQFYRRSPLTWCTIQACYNSMLENGVDNKPANVNKLLLPKTSSIYYEDTYVADFLKFLHPIDTTLVTKKKNIIHSIFSKMKMANPVSALHEKPAVSNNSCTLKSSYLYGLYEYPINWCAVKICHDDLINAGFIFKTFKENYDVLPKIKQALENNIGKRIVEIINEVIDLLFGYRMESFFTEYINTYIGKVIGNFAGDMTKTLFVKILNDYLGELFGMKFKEYLIKKFDNEEPNLYIRMLFDLEKLLLLDDRFKIYQSEFVYKYSSHLEILVLKEDKEESEMYIPADREKRTPFEWCMFTVVHDTLQL